MNKRTAANDSAGEEKPFCELDVHHSRWMVKTESDMGNGSKLFRELQSYQ